MILYVNGDSHSAAGEAVNDFCFANDDPKYPYSGRIPHPDNLRVSYGNMVGSIIKAKFICGAESASSNDRIIRTTKEFLERKQNEPVLVIIGWSTWEREEWLHDDVYWQVNAGGVGEDWPDEIKERYKPWVAGLDLKKKVAEEHEKIHNFHLELAEKGIKHLFFNSFDAFDVAKQYDWGNNYVHPYDKTQSYYNYSLSAGCVPTKPNGYHFGPDAHTGWARNLLKYLTKIL